MEYNNNEALNFKIWSQNAPKTHMKVRNYALGFNVKLCKLFEN